MMFAVALLSVLSGCTTTVPTHSNAWLSYKYGLNCGAYFNSPNDLNGSSAIPSQNCVGLSDFNEAMNYYSDIGAPINLTAWKSNYGFPTTGNPPARGLYANNLDLRLGRDMNCVQSGQQIACYVTNYGPPPQDCTVVLVTNPDGSQTATANCPWPDLESAVNDAITGNNPIATVAMVYNGTPNSTSNSPSNNITFYVYDQNGHLLPWAALDDEGAKSVPRMCMACHGGSYTAHTSTTTASVTGASFLPFDVPSFYYSQANPSLGQDQQQEAFRQLNLLVKAANGGSQPAASQTAQQAAIVDFINGLYCPDIHGGIFSHCATPVENAGSKARDIYFPIGWSGSQKVYSELVKPYCRMCHMAQTPTFFNSSGLTSTAQNFACTLKDMPHAEVPFGGPAAFQNNEKTIPSINPFIDQQIDHTHFWLDSVAINDLKTALNISSCQ
jgi:hypothetical protein